MNRSIKCYYSSIEERSCNNIWRNGKGDIKYYVHQYQTNISIVMFQTFRTKYATNLLINHTKFR